MSKTHHRFYQVGGITLKVESDLPIRDTTFHPKFRVFETQEPGQDLVTLRHHFEIPQSSILDERETIYSKPPWIIRRNGTQWIYLNLPGGRKELKPDNAAIFNSDYREGDLYSNGAGIFEAGCVESLTLFPTDQILLGRLLADRQGCLLHSSGVILNGMGLLFLGHSEAGKSTMVRLLQEHSEVLCDDRMIVRRWPETFRIHGSWSHGEIETVSGASAPLLGIFFLTKSVRNSIVPVVNSSEILSRLLACLIKPLCTADWWNKVLETLEKLARETRFYEVEFDKSGRIADILKRLSETR